MLESGDNKNLPVYSSSSDQPYHRPAAVGAFKKERETRGEDSWANKASSGRANYALDAGTSTRPYKVSLAR